MAEIKEINSIDEFDRCISDNKKVAIKFSADWCGPCRMMSNTISNMADEDLNGFKFFEINVDKDFATGLCETHQVRSIPLMLYYVNGNIASRSVGMQQAGKIKELVGKM